MLAIYLPDGSPPDMFAQVEDVMQARTFGFQMREELLRLHGGVQVTLEEATITGNLCIVESNLREIERRLSRLIALPMPLPSANDDRTRS